MPNRKATRVGLYLTRTVPTTARTPVIVMTGHGNDGPYQAVEALRIGAVHYVTKPFGLCVASLDDAIRTELPDAASGNKAGKLGERIPQPFDAGEMVFSAERVELCAVKICGGPKCGMIRRILDELRQRKTSGLFVAYSGSELANRIKCPAGQTGVAGAIREFRRKTTDLILEEANVQCAPRDIIASGGRGYRLTEKIHVRDADDPVNDPVNDPDDPDRDPVNDPDTATLNARQEWVLDRLRDRHPLRIGEVRAQFKCSDSTAKRVLNELKSLDHIEFVGPAKTGHYQLKRSNQADSRSI